MTSPNGNDAPRSVRIGLLGFGNVGSAFVGLLEADRAEIRSRTGFDLTLSTVAVRDLKKVRPLTARGAVLTEDGLAVATSPHVDVVVEVIGGIEPARSFIVAALKSGKPVVTANKELLANHGPELYALSAETSTPLLFEAAVGGAIPLVRAIQVSLSGERINRIVGIVNGTTNFILSKMSLERISYHDALAEAQRLGYAEPNPSADVEGFDAAAKAAILASIAFNAEVVQSQVYREGIESISIDDIGFAERLGYAIKLLAIAERGEEESVAEASIAVRVHPAMVPLNHPLASVNGPFNALFIEGQNSGELMLYGRGAGGRPTASALLGDALDAARDLEAKSRAHLGRPQRLKIKPIDELRTQYYLAIDVADRPGVLGDVAGVFGRNGVSIRSMEQVGLGAEARLVFITHTAREADLQATLDELRRLDAVDRVGSVLRVIGPEG